MHPTARFLAFVILKDIEQNHAYANLSLNKTLSKAILSDEDRRLTTEIVYGTVRMRLHLDTELNAYCDVKKTDAQVLLLLRMSVYQLEYLSNVPDYAVINEAVEMCKRVHPRSSRFVNAVLRAYVRKDKNIRWPDKFKQRNQYISKWYSFPQWMVDQWIKAYGFEETEKLCAYFNEPAPSWIRVNTLRYTPEDLTAVLNIIGIKYNQHHLIKEAFQVESLQPLLRDRAFSDGMFIVQDLSAMLPALVLTPEKESTVLDMCAAPGGKTTQLSAIMQNGGHITACDIHEKRTALIKANIARLNAGNITVLCDDATKLSSDYIRRFDYILLDAPCSGLGVLNRRPDLRWNKHRSDLSDILTLQEKLLDSAAVYAANRSVLVYSTCTLNAAENEEQVEKFLSRHIDFRLAEFEILGEKCDGMHTIYPFQDHSDGFFMAKMVKGE